MPALIALAILAGAFLGAQYPEEFQLRDTTPEVEAVDEWEGV